jgi:hypothetical protein
MKNVINELKAFMQLEIMIPMWVAVLLVVPAAANIVLSVVKALL